MARRKTAIIQCWLSLPRRRESIPTSGFLLPDQVEDMFRRNDKGEIKEMRNKRLRAIYRKYLAKFEG